MSSLAETIENAFAAVGTETERRLHDVSAAFEALELDDEERVAALATAIAAIAYRHHKRHVPVYLEAVRSWSLEIAEMLQPAPTEHRYIPDRDVIEEGANCLYGGLDGIIDRMRSQGIDIRDRLVTELAVFARFLGQHDTTTITIALMAVTRALNDPAYERGSVVRVPLREVVAAPKALPDIETAEPIGRA
ncbi:MAG TPA: hypothetical protein VLX09_06940 [Stellaceae bacterium]|nr:hypothetical protein [Stellaceae bacterium]